MNRSTFTHPAILVFAFMLLVPTFLLGNGSASAATFSAGTVYTLTNAAAGNAIAIFSRATDGTLTSQGTVASGGLGTGTGLGSQGAVVLDKDQHWLFAVNAGSNDIAVFAVGNSSIRLLQTISSGGIQPISITVHDKLVYVLNAGDTGNITGFIQSDAGILRPLTNSTRPLSNHAAGPAEIAFNPDGTLLAVTEKATNNIDTYVVGPGGRTIGPVVAPSAGMTPFGFAWTWRGQLLVSEAFGGMTNGSAATSYSVSRNGSSHVISASVPTHQTAACWLVDTYDSRYAYTANAGSNTISGYSVGNDGSLTLLNSDGITGTTGDSSHPIDLALSRYSRYLYVLNNGNGTIGAFAVQSDGSLLPANGGGGLPLSASGLAAR